MVGCVGVVMPVLADNNMDFINAVEKRDMSGVITCLKLGVSRAYVSLGLGIMGAEALDKKATQLTEYLKQYKALKNLYFSYLEKQKDHDALVVYLGFNERGSEVDLDFERERVSLFRAEMKKIEESMKLLSDKSSEFLSVQIDIAIKESLERALGSMKSRFEIFGSRK